MRTRPTALALAILLCLAVVSNAAPPDRLLVRDSTSSQAVTTFPADGRAYDVWNNAFVQSLQQYVEDRAAYEAREAPATITGVKTFTVNPIFNAGAIREKGVP